MKKTIFLIIMLLLFSPKIINAKEETINEAYLIIKNMVPPTLENNTAKIRLLSEVHGALIFAVFQADTVLDNQKILRCLAKPVGVWADITLDEYKKGSIRGELPFTEATSMVIYATCFMPNIKI